MATQSLPALVEAVHAIGAGVIALYADDVDRNARFPSESIDALRKEGLLGALVPETLGGMGLTIHEVAQLCAALGQYCASTAMVLAMHQIQVACLVRHGLPSKYFEGYLRELAARQMLIASATSEVGVGGDTRRSICCVERKDGGFRLDKDATTISYGQAADDILVTARRAPEATPSDQVLVLVRRGDFTLSPTSEWDTLGMRGTCSPGFKLASRGAVEQIVPGAFSEASSQTMVPFAHVLWSSVWLGIAIDAVGRAGTFVRAEARRNPGTTPPMALRLAEVTNTLQTMRANVHDVSVECETLQSSPAGNEAMLAIGFALKMNNLKISCSRLAAEVVHQALLICGILGYKNGTKFSLGRHLRDVHSAALMVGNDRIFATNASLLLVQKDL